MEYLPQRVIAALVFAVCVSVAATTSSVVVTVIALVVAVAFPVVVERNVRQHRQARDRVEGRR